ncbi:MAG: DUF2190 family protein [Eubacterium sp.]|nr:DUF2190 family protein [Eubacterium sp.]
MKASYYQKGETLDYVNTTKGKIEAGTVLILGNRIGVAGTDIEAGAIGSVHVSGVYELDKKDTEELAVGTAVYFTADGITAAASEGTDKDAVQNIPAGFVAAASPAKSTKVHVKINA